MGARPTTRIFTGKFVERSIEPAGNKGLAGPYFLSAIPPVGVVGSKYILTGWVWSSLRLLRAFFSFFV